MRVFPYFLGSFFVFSICLLGRLAAPEVFVPLPPDVSTGIPVALLLSGYDLDMFFAGNNVEDLFPGATHPPIADRDIDHLVLPLAREGYKVSTFICVANLSDPQISREQTTLGLKNYSANLNIKGVLEDLGEGHQFERVESCFRLARQFEQAQGAPFQVFLRARPDTVFYQNFSLRSMDPKKVSTKAKYVIYATPHNISAQEMSDPGENTEQRCRTPFNTHVVRASLKSMGLPWCAQFDNQWAVVPRRYMRVLEWSKPCTDYNYSSVLEVCPWQNFGKTHSNGAWSEHLFPCTGTEGVDLRAFPMYLANTASKKRNPGARPFHRWVNRKDVLKNDSFIC
jgi:hypothetical protein